MQSAGSYQMRTKFCKYCKEYFKTEHKHADVCPECKFNNRKKKTMNNLFGGSILFVTISE
jgi:Zn finger protein HypA/HybF involved in hydrogenase expression